MHNFRVSELRLVKLTMKGKDGPTDHSHVHMVHESDVDTLVRGSVMLHHEVGNIHTGEHLGNLWKIEVGSLETEHARSYWWTTRDLKRNGDPNGAKIIGERWERVWAHPDLLALDKRAEEQED